MYYVYIIKSKRDNSLYTGFTNDLDRRISEHNKGCQISTKNKIPFDLIYYEWCLNKDDAIRREKYLKSGVGKKYIYGRLKQYLVVE